MSKEQLAIDHLKGVGIEFGALHNPIPIDANKASVIYADKLTRSEAIAAFPEIEGDFKDIVEPDLILDLDLDSFDIIKQKKLDFVVANHVIEHVVNPIRFLKNISDNLKQGGLVLLTVPNKDYTHDVNRKVTRYSHLRLEYFLGTKRLSNLHIRDYLKNKLPVENVHPKTIEHFKKNGIPLSYYKGNKLPINPVKRKKLFDYQRSRSIHVHVWDRKAFNFFLHRSIDLYNLKFEIIEYLPPEKSAGEIIYLLKKIKKTNQ